MKVSELISFLEDMDPNANVILCTQENYPMEYRLEQVVLRSTFQESTDDRRDLNDVLLVEGSWVGYGSKKAWEEF